MNRHNILLYDKDYLFYITLVQYFYVNESKKEVLSFISYFYLLKSTQSINFIFYSSLLSH